MSVIWSIFSPAASKKGICNEFLNDAKDYIVLNDFDRAELMAREAINYQKENKKDLPENYNMIYSNNKFSVIKYIRKEG